MPPFEGAAFAAALVEYGVTHPVAAGAWLVGLELAVTWELVRRVKNWRVVDRDARNKERA